jgi:hypothetical protein
MPPLELLLNGTGATALALNISGLAHPNDRTLRTKTGAAALLWALNNFLMGAHSAAALSLVSASRQATVNAVDARGGRARQAAFAAFMAITLLAGLLTWSGPVSAFTTAGSLLTCVAVFHLRDARLRWAMVASAALWMVNAVVFDSGWQVAANLLAAAAAGWGAVRAEARPEAPARVPRDDAWQRAVELAHGRWGSALPDGARAPSLRLQRLHLAAMGPRG